MHDVDDAKRAAAERPEQRQGGDGPQDEAEVEVAADVGAVVGLADGHGQDGVGHHPADDHVRAHGAVVVLLLLGLAKAGGDDLETVAQVAQRLVVARVDVQLLARHLQLDRVALVPDRRAQVRVDHVVALGAPGDVVRVAEGVDLQRADVRWEQGEVLRRGSDHVPWIQVQEGHEEVQAHGRGGRDDQVGEDVVAQTQLGEGILELDDDDVERGEGVVGHDYGIDDHAGHEHFLCTVVRQRWI